MKIYIRKCEYAVTTSDKPLLLPYDARQRRAIEGRIQYVLTRPGGEQYVTSRNPEVPTRMRLVPWNAAALARKLHNAVEGVRLSDADGKLKVVVQ